MIQSPKIAPEQEEETTVVATRQSRFCSFRIPAENVGVPTLKVLALTEVREPEVVLQWFGRDILEPHDLDGEQFFFPIPLRPDDIRWMGHPERFRVIYVGPIRHWTYLTGGAPFQGDPDEYVLWVASSHYRTQYSTGPGPASFAIQLTITLADQEYGVIIKPTTYCNLNALEELNREVAALTAQPA